MRDCNFWSLSYQHMVFFLAVVECGTMTKASKELNVTQPLLSQKIAQMEEAMGVELFHREKKRLTLTEAGACVYQNLQKIRNELIDMAAEAKHLAEKETNVIHVGWINSADLGRIAACVQQMKEAVPGLTVKPHYLDTMEIFDRIKDGTLDFMIAPYDYQDDPELKATTIKLLPMYVSMGEQHPLASREELDWPDLEPYTFLLPGIRNQKVYPAVVRNIAKMAGFPPKAVFTDWGPMKIGMELLVGDSVTVTTVQMGNLKGIKHFPMRGTKCPLILVWRKDNQKRIANYIGPLKEILQKTLDYAE